MKRILVSTFLSLMMVSAFSQTQRYYCEIKGIQKALSVGLKIVFDFGENPIYTAWGGLKSKQKLVDEKGEEIQFNSMVDAGNYMSSKGWNLQQAYTSVYGDNIIVHWIFYKDADNPQDAIKGIMTKEQYNRTKK